MNLLYISPLIKNNEIKNRVNRLDDMLLFQDVSINDVNEVVKKTCNDLSLVDYLILSSNLYSVIKNFDVLDYDPSFSDVHCALQFSFSVDICLLSTEYTNISPPVKWYNSKKEEFVEYITVNENNEIKT